MSHLEEQLVKATKRVNARLMDGTEVMILGDLGYLIFSYRNSVDAVKVDGDDLNRVEALAARLAKRRAELREKTRARLTEHRDRMG